MLKEIYKCPSYDRASHLLREFAVNTKKSNRPWMAIITLKSWEAIIIMETVEEYIIEDVVKFFKKLDKENPYSHVKDNWSITCVNPTGKLKTGYVYRVHSMSLKKITVHTSDNLCVPELRTYLRSRFGELIEEILPF